MTEHPYWELTAVVSGQADLVSDTSISLCPGSLTLLPPGFLHRESSHADVDTIWIGCQGSRFEALPRHPVVIRDLRLVAECEQLWLLTQQAQSRVGPELDARLTMLVALILRTRDLSLTRERGDILNDLIRHMHENLSQPLRVADLAQRAGCSEGYFSRIFRRRTGQSVIEFLNGLRVQQAAHLLEHTGLTAGEIAERVGFCSPSYFNRIFRQRTGMAPQAYRHQL